MKFKYGDKVLIKRDGFFYEAVGRVIDWNEFLTSVNLQTPPAHEYSVLLEYSLDTTWFNEDELVGPIKD